MANTPDASALPLPPGFHTIEEIKNMPSERVRAENFFNVIGFVKDFQAPMKCQKGTNYICTIEILDHSIQFESHGLKVTFFWPKQCMPETMGARDIVLIQMRKGCISLLANFGSVLHVFSPKNEAGESKLKWKPYCYDSRNVGIPNTIEMRYVNWASSQVNELDLPSDHEFEKKTKQAMTVQEKFSQLKDVEPGKFYNILGEIIRIYDAGGPGTQLTVYLSDYTAHSDFYNYTWNEGTVENGRDGDEFGYTKSMKKEAKAWPGPFGKLTIQLTLYDCHAEFVRDNVKVNEWVFLSNVQIKLGNMGGRLEGFLRGDRDRSEGLVRVTLMEQSEEPEENDSRWKEAVRRKRLWEEKFKQQRQDILDVDTGSGLKRKNDEESSKYNSKKRRKEKRALELQKAAENHAKSATRVDLNENIRCGFPDQPIISIKKILEPRVLLREDKIEQISAPFTVCKYKANVRVVDYFPHRIEDFSVGRKPSEFDMLSDYSGDEDTDHEEDLRNFRKGKGFGRKVWEWRFALQVEDASKDAKERIWLMVDNHAAQGLLNLEENATNLRGNHELLAALNEQLFKLWGDLEEQKSSALPKLPAKEKKEPPSSFQSSASTPPRKVGGQPDLDSDDEMENTSFSTSKKSESTVLQERDSNILMATTNGAVDDKGKKSLAPRNKAFTCCIKQYGIKVKEDDPDKANSGPGERWQRMFGISDTIIL